MNSEAASLMRESLARLPIVIKLSDPWELGEALGWKELEGIIADVDVRADKLYGNQEELALVKLDSPFEYESTRCEYFVVSPRHEGSSLHSLISGDSVFCGITRISQEQAHSKDPFDLSKWRGGVAAIATLEAKK